MSVAPIRIAERPAVALAPPSATPRESLPSLWRVPPVTVVVPARDEAANIGWVLSRLPLFVTRVVLVDGSADDRTALAARDHRPDVEVISQTPAGKGAALVTGLLAAPGEIAVMMDADGSMDPAEIQVLVAALLAGADVAKGSRMLAGAGSDDLNRLRRTGSRLLTFTANRLYHHPWSELCYGYAAFWTDVLPTLGLDRMAVTAPIPRATARIVRRFRRGIAYGNGFEIEAILFTRAVRAGLRVTEVASFEHARRNGQSNLVTFRDGARVLMALLNERGYVPAGESEKRRTYPIPPAVLAAARDDAGR